MRKKRKFINTLKNTDNRKYFISSLDVGDVWISKDAIREPKGYNFSNFKKQNMSLSQSKANTTKKFMDEMINNFLNSKQQFKSITEDISCKTKETINIYSNFPLLFLNFIKLDLSNQNKVEEFVYRFGLLGDEDNRENHFDSSQRIEPLLLWQYEQWHLSYTYYLWELLIKIEEKKEVSKKLLNFFKPVNKSGVYDPIPRPHTKTNFPKIFEPFKKLSSQWIVTNDHSSLIQAAKACVGILIQDHLEHRVSFPVNFLDFNRPTPMFETDSLIATLWLQFLRFVRYGARTGQCKQCNYDFEQIQKNKIFCSDFCKIKYYNNKNKDNK